MNSLISQAKEKEVSIAFRLTRPLGHAVQAGDQYAAMFVSIAFRLTRPLGLA